MALTALLFTACGGDDGGGGGEAGAGEGGQGESPGDGSAGEGGGAGDAVSGGAAGASAAGQGGTLTGTWEGTYTCAQGATPLRLTLLDVAGGAVEGFFEFGATAGGPEPGGSFRVQGAESAGTLTLEGLDWVQQPDGYGMVGVEADTPSDDSDHLTGRIVGSGCETFDVNRVATDPWYAGAWEGGYICAQGRTDLALEIEPTGGNAVTATVEFSAFEGNPGVPTGSYTLEGTWTDGALDLTPVEWIEQPPGYMMVGITSNPDLAIGPNLLAGAITDPTCEQFIMERPQG